MGAMASSDSFVQFGHGCQQVCTGSPTDCQWSRMQVEEGGRGRTSCDRLCHKGGDQ